VGTALGKGSFVVWAKEYGSIMGSNLATVVVEARLLIRAALKSMMAKNSYRIVCDVGSAAELSASAVSDEPKLVILGAQSADNAVGEAAAIRKLWPVSKIILLYEHPVDFQKLQTSEISGCVPLFASPATLIGMLDLIVVGSVRVMLVPSAKCPAIQPAQTEELHRSNIKMATIQSDGAEHEDASDGIRTMHTELPVNAASTHPSLSNSDALSEPTHAIHSKLSPREVQILNGLVKGQANKVIGRAYNLTEATVKIHVKNILRKIRVANRTQAAMWAIENGHAAVEFKGSSSTLTSTSPSMIQ
jgi:two-component system nitrate/nitrite response regulator NarL